MVSEIGTPIRSKASRWVGVGLGEHGDGGRGSGEADLVAGEGGQVVDQAAEAAVGAAGFVVLAGGFGLGAGGPLGGGDRVAGGGFGFLLAATTAAPEIRAFLTAVVRWLGGGRP